MTSNKRIKEIAVEVAGQYDGYEYIGIRIQEENTNKVGDTMTHCSSVWDNGDETEEQLDGVSAIDIDMAGQLNNADYEGYFGGIVYILGSDNASYGEDVAEIIMQDAVVLAVIE